MITNGSGALKVQYNSPREKKRKFLKNIYIIQGAFGTELGKTQRTICCSITPDKEDKIRLDEWFNQVKAAKDEIYKEIYCDFKKAPHKYLKETFKYDTFFKGRSTIHKMRKKYNLVTSQPAAEGLCMEITGTMRSFKTNYKRLFDENLDHAKALGDAIKKHSEALLKEGIDAKECLNALALDKLLQELRTLDFETVAHDFGALQSLERAIDLINKKIGDYNYELNQIVTACETKRLRFLGKLNRLPSFPHLPREDVPDRQVLLNELIKKAQGAIASESVINFINAREKFLSKTFVKKDKPQKKRFEDRIIAWLLRERNENGLNEKQLTQKFIESFEAKVRDIPKRLDEREGAGSVANKNEYLRLLGLKARLIAPTEERGINRLLGQIRGSYFKGGKQRETVVFPGFSWDQSPGGRPRKNIALAFNGGTLCVCVSNSVKDFKIDPNGHLNFVKTIGGGRKRNSNPKQISYVRGRFHNNAEDGKVPLFLPLHFGKSYARRNFFHREWGISR